MAVIPGTKFAEAQPSGQVGQTLWNPPREGGGQQIAQGIEKLGAVVLNYALDVQKQEMAAEYYEKRRLIDEAGWAAHNAVTGDEETDRVLWEKFQSDAQAIAGSSKYKDVNDELTQHVNQVSPNWQQSMFTAGLTIRKENAKDQFRLNYEKSLENGDILTANEMVDKQLALKIISQEEHNELIRTVHNASRLAAAERLAYMGDKEGALKLLNQIDEKTATTDQLKIRNALVKEFTAQVKSNDILKQREAINTFTQQLLDPTTNGWIKDIEIEKIKTTLSEVNYSKWSKIYKHQGDVPVATTKWDKYKVLQDRLMDMWEHKKDSDAEDLQTDFATAYLVDKTISRKEYSELISRLGEKPPPPNVINDIKVVFGNLSALEPDEDEEAIVKRGIYYYVREQLENGKTPAYTDINNLLKGIKVTKAKTLLQKIIGEPPKGEGQRPWDIFKPGHKL